MAKTFEELVGQQLDRLYQGALFLSGGDARAAESLLIDAVSAAFVEYPQEEGMPSVERWFDARLVRACLKRTRDEGGSAPPRARGAPASGRESFDDLGARELFEAAATLSVRPRAALWLVLLRRWPYASAASALGVEQDEIAGLLEYRGAFLDAVVTASRGARGRMERGG